MENLENKTLTVEEINSISNTALNITSIGGLAFAAASMVYGHYANVEAIEGFGYGLLSMDLIINATRASSYLLGKTSQN